MPSGCRYIWLFWGVCGIPFIYNENNKGLNKDSWGPPQFMIPASKTTSLSDKTTKAQKSETILFFLCDKPAHFILPTKKVWFKASKSYSRLIRIITALLFPFLAPLQIMSVNWDRHVSVKWFFLKLD